MEYVFAAHLDRYGPHRTPPPMSLSRARLYCERLARAHYENFLVGTLLLPRHLRHHFFAVYAFCRWADDLADEAGGSARALALLEWWESELAACYRGESRHPVMIALRATVERFDLPKRPFLDLIAAFSQDQYVKRYKTVDELYAYCRGSANPVGRLLLRLFGCHTDENAELSDRVCTGLQLANFWQDVSRDLELNRIYLPEEDRKRFGVREEDLFDRRFSAGFRDLMRFEVERARDLLYRGLPLAENVPREVRVDVELFARGGLAILDRIERRNYDVLSGRPSVGKWTQARLVLSAAARRFLGWTL